MRFSVLSVLLLGCDNNAPEITINPNPAPDAEPEIVHIEHECTTPSPNVYEEKSVAFYNLDRIVEGSGCEDGNLVLTFSFDFSRVMFSCNPPDDPFLWYECAIPLAEVNEHYLDFAPPRGSESPRRYTANFQVINPPESVTVDIRSLPPVTGACAGLDLALSFWAEKDGANTLCLDDDGFWQGYGEIKFPDQLGTIFLDAMTASSPTDLLPYEERPLEDKLWRPLGIGL